MTSENMDFIMKFTQSIDFEGFNYILMHKDTFIHKFGQRAVWYLEESAIPNDLSKRFPKIYQSEVVKDSLRDYVKQFVSKRIMEKTITRASIFQLNRERQDSLLVLTMIRYMENFGTEDPYTLNHFAWNVYEKSDSPTTLQLGIQWVLKAIQNENNSDYHDTAANLFFKVKDKAKATFHANKSIDLGQIIGQNVSDTKALLLKINKL